MSDIEILGSFKPGGNTTVAGTSGQIQFNGGGTLSADSGLFWDNSTKRLGIGTTTPSSPLQVIGTGANPALQVTGTFNNSYVKVTNTDGSSSLLLLQASNGKSGSFFLSGDGSTLEINTFDGAFNHTPLLFDTTNQRAVFAANVDAPSFSLAGNAGASGTVTAGGHTLIFNGGILTSFT